MASRILYFGGTFDPVHNGHLEIARALGRAVGASCVLLVPTAGNPLKSPPVASAEDRLAMLELAVAGEELFDICTLELNRTPPIYTIETIEQLQRQLEPETEIHLALGADMLADLPKWHRITELLGLVHLTVACRPPLAVQAVEVALKKLAAGFKKMGLQQFNAAAVTTPMLDVSSTEIRQRLLKEKSVEPYVNKEVAEYIARAGLYTGAGENGNPTAAGS